MQEKMKERFAAVIALLAARTPLGAKSRVRQLVADGKAEEVFTPKREARLARGRKRLPHAIISYTTSADETRDRLEELCSDPAVESAYVAPERRIWARRTQELSGTDQSAKTGWQYSEIFLPSALPDASSVKIGVIDTGVDEGHQAFLGVDIRKLPDPNDVDTMGHGTHVTGIIAGDNGVALRRLCNATVIVYKALGPYDPKTYYNMLQTALDDCDVINLSLGGPEDDLETQIIDIAMTDDRAIVVAAMGNEEDEDGSNPSFPAALPGVIAVGACDPSRARARFSNCGDHIHIAAPGVQIYSAVPRSGSKLAPKSVHYASWDGTSMAAPIVASACAMLRAKDPRASASLIKGKLKARFAPGQVGWNREFGIGIIDLGATLG